MLQDHISVLVWLNILILGSAYYYISTYSLTFEARGLQDGRQSLTSCHLRWKGGICVSPTICRINSRQPWTNIFTLFLLWILQSLPSVGLPSVHHTQALDKPHHSAALRRFSSLALAASRSWTVTTTTTIESLEIGTSLVMFVFFECCPSVWTYKTWCGETQLERFFLHHTEPRTSWGKASMTQPL